MQGSAELSAAMDSTAARYMGLALKVNWPHWHDARSDALAVLVTAILVVAMGAVAVMSAGIQGSVCMSFLSLSP